MKALLLFILSWFGCPTEISYTQTEQANATVLMMTQCGFGSGAIVSDKHVLTAAHVVACPGPIIAKDTNGVYRILVVEVAHFSLDLARATILHGPPFATPGKPYIVEPGDWVCAETATPKQGRECGKVTKVDPGGWKLEFDINIVSGNSGSALWDKKGNLVGVVGCAHVNTKQGCGTQLSGREWIISTD